MENLFNKKLIQYLKLLKFSEVTAEDDRAGFLVSGKPFLALTSNDISLAGISFQTVFDSNSEEVLLDKINEFAMLLKDLGAGTSLNHLGVSYFCDDLNGEVTNIKDLVKGNWDLYEDSTNEKGQRWLFLGKPMSSPLFEFVLNEGYGIDDDLWRPHFQIDLNTNLEWSPLREMISQHLGADFIQWDLTLPEVGTVLVMGVLANYGNCKIALGLRSKVTSKLFENSLKQI